MNQDDKDDSTVLMLAYLCVANEAEASIERKVQILDRFGLSNAQIARVCGGRSRIDIAMEITGSRRPTPPAVLPVHLVTLGHLEELIKKYRSDCIPELFPTLEFFLGHMDVIKRVRNMYSHMFPCIDRNDARIAKREILTLAAHINTKLDQLLPR